ncbi:NAD(P)-dependent oxidoreductase [Streptomonospora litoralis]|uniref:3-hydroxyisobutyrate dehydrogenase n=1 Tax=Streptomonospora litoralis TaxID=2498135 RepID=A0A4P6Q7S1_9ACTN|nr:NAD(P)-binding domain-containing protein [Streptomonospora litoralis]QBI56440.1 3-hydroxyisobutyrate dehydrogenase [Streptomonospora litoralis]
MTAQRSDESAHFAAPAPVTVLGLGPMGRALASAFLRAGHPTTVWNRSPAKAEALADLGAAHAATPAAAAEAAGLVVVCVLDYDAAEQILAPAADALRGRTLLNLTADTPERARAMAEWAAARGIDYLDGAVMSPAGTVGGPSAVYLYSGPGDLYDRHRPELAALGGTATHLGADHGRAATYDLALLDLFWSAMSGMAHAFALARAEGVAASELAPFAVGISELMEDIIPATAADVDAGRAPGDDAAIASAAASMAHIADAAEARGIDSALMRAAQAAARRAVEDGRGQAGWAHMTEVLAAEPAGVG